MKTVLILCTGNSCRSQMAEAFARQFFPATWAAYSAGIEKHGLNPYMLHVMEEEGLDMSTHFSKMTDELPSQTWDLVITVCAHAEENCPYMPSEKHIHLGFEDPPSLAQGLSSDEEILPIYRRVRDEIKTAFQKLSEEYEA